VWYIGVSGENNMTPSVVWISWTLFSGCKLFGAIEEARELLDDPVTMQGVYVGLEVPSGMNAEGTLLDVGAQAQAWVQRTGTSGVSTVEEAKVSLISDRRGSVKLSLEGAAWIADGNDGLEYVVGDEVKLVADYGGERGSISMKVPPGPVADISENHAPGIGMRVTISHPDIDYDNGGILVYDLLNSNVVWESDYDVSKPVDPDNLVIDVDGSVFEANGLYAVGVLGLVASDEADLIGLNALGSGMLAGQMVLYPLSTL
jgi:hypothetical protein